MTNLVTFEGFTTGKFNDFIKKYSKTTYVSKTDIKRMNDSDMKYEYFKKLEKDVDMCQSFFKSNDIDLLGDILLDVFDDFPVRITGYTFYLSCRDTEYWGSDEIRIVVSENDNGEKVLGHRGIFTNKEKMMSGVINGICDARERMVNRTKSDLTDSVVKQMEKDPKQIKTMLFRSYDREKIRSMSKRNPFKKIIIKPELEIECNLEFKNNKIQMYGIVTPEMKEEREKREGFEKSMKAAISRYLVAIGYGGTYFSQAEGYPGIKIKFF
jgi:hypothetical protein